MTLAFSCHPEILRRLADRVGGVVDRTSSSPILRNLLLADDGAGRLTLTATDVDITAAATSAPGEVEIAASGATTVPSDILRAFLKKLGKVDRLDFASAGKAATIRAGRSTFQPFELPAADFPATKAIDRAVRLSMSSAQLRRIFEACEFAICTDETRYFLCGVFLHSAEAAPALLTSVATDGHKLSRLFQEIEGDVAAMPAVIVPRKTVRLFETIADAAGDTPVALEVSAERIGFEAGELRIDLAIGFNSIYALEALESFDTHSLEVALADPASPALLTAPGDDSRLVVLMPMRV